MFPSVGCGVRHRRERDGMFDTTTGPFDIPLKSEESSPIIADSDEEKSDCKFAELVACGDQAAIMNSDAIKVRRALMSFAGIRATRPSLLG
jgi:hypothetical protein